MPLLFHFLCHAARWRSEVFAGRAWWVQPKAELVVTGVVQQIDNDHPGAPPRADSRGGKVGIDCGITEQGKDSPAVVAIETSPIEMLATESRVR